MVKVLFVASLIAGAAAQKKYGRGFVRRGANANAVTSLASITDEMRATAPASIDWSTMGATTAVKDQGDCGSCWAYSATQGIESGLFMTTKQIMDLSEQQIISCEKEDDGCDGGDLPTAFAYVQQNGGIDTMADYKDTSANSGRTGFCNIFRQWRKKVVKVTGFHYAVPPCVDEACEGQKESDMMAALHSFGPLSVCVNANDWDDYGNGTVGSGGVYSTTCSGAIDDLDHCVQVVGYDTTGSQSYWKVRNSWGTGDWGEEGHMRLKMGENACGIADEAMYVTATLVSEDVSV